MHGCAVDKQGELTHVASPGLCSIGIQLVWMEKMEKSGAQRL
jgi:hypothetical protein